MPSASVETASAATVETATGAAVEASTFMEAAAVAVPDVTAAIDWVTIIAAAIVAAIEATPPGRVEAESEWAPIGTAADECVIPHIRIPVPPGIKADHACVLPGDLIVGFGQVLRTQAAPFVKAVLRVVGVELGRLLGAPSTSANS